MLVGLDAEDGTVRRDGKFRDYVRGKGELMRGEGVITMGSCGERDEMITVELCVLQEKIDGETRE